MRFQVLGPLEVHDSGLPLDLGGPKQRTVLAVLVANSGTPVSTERLIQAVYGDEAPDGARRSVQTYVSNLRSQLGDTVTSSGGGYEFAPVDSSVDAGDFVAKVDTARSEIDDDPAAAADSLRGALQLWRGHPFQDIEAFGELDAPTTRLSELRAAALELRVDADLALGHHRQLIGELEALTSEHPFRERFRWQLMLALYRAGRQAEALRAYQRMRSTLAEELGIDPSPGLRQLEQQILEQDPSLLLDSPSAVRRRALLVVDLPVDTLVRLDTDARSEALATLGRIIDDAIGEAGGKVAAQQATATYATFDGVRAALDAATAIVAAGDGAANVRLAVDVGDIEERRDGTVHGPAVIRAAGLVAAAHPGQVLLSADAHSAAAEDAAGGWLIRALGVHPIARLEASEAVHQLVFDGQADPFPPLRTDGAPPELPDARFGVSGYELRAELGRGSFGTVYQAYQPSVGREVAIKVINPEIANDPAFIRRFAVEAQMVARIEHPHVVPLYDYWRGPDQAMLVMRLMRGGNLADRVARRKLDRGEVRRLVDQAGGALVAAHSAGVVHGDVRAGNLLLNEAGDFFLGDFGVAGETKGAAARQDVSAFCELVSRAAADGAIGSAESDVLAARGYADAEELLAAWRDAVGVAASAAFTPTRNPYKGLASFAEPDAADFHGRDDVVAALSSAVADHRLVGVVGPSGVGKSSVVRAGLVPALRNDAVVGSSGWLITDFNPGRDPYGHLANALERVASSSVGDMDAELRTGDTGLVNAVDRFLPDGVELLLIVDQFEELFTMVHSEEERDAFLGLLVAAARDTRIRQVITLRADFFDRPLGHPDFGSLLHAATVPVAVPDDDGLLAIISEPAQSVGVRLEDGLADQMLADVRGEAGALPLLEFALTELFDNRDSDVLTFAAYNAAGGVTGALGHRAETVFSALSPEDRLGARQVLMRLVNPGDAGRDTRRRVRISELRQLGLDSRTVTKVLDDFGTARLLTFDRDEASRAPTVEVAHEALLREWPRFAGWIDGHREELVLQGRLAAAVTDWNRSDRTDDYLLRGGRLAQHESFAASTDLPLAENERDLLAASRRAEDAQRDSRRRRRRLVLAGFAVAAVVGLVLASVAFAARRQADDRRLEAEEAQTLAEQNAERADENQQRALDNADLADERAVAAQSAEALAEARELAASAINVLAEDPELATLLTLQAIDAAPPGQEQPVEVINALWKAGQANRLVDQYETGYPGQTGIDLSADGTRLVIAAAEGASIQMYDTVTGELLWERIEDTFDSLELPAFQPGGPLVAISALDGDFSARDPAGVDDLPSRVLILEAATGDLVETLEFPDCGGGLPVWTPDGSRLTFTPDPAGCGRPEVPGPYWVEFFDATSWESVAVVPIERQGFASVSPAFADSGDMVVFDVFGPPIIFSADLQPARTLDGIFGSGDVSPDGTRLVLSQLEEATIGIYDVATGDKIDSLTPVNQPAALPDGTTFSADGDLVLAAFRGAESRVWNVQSGELEFELPAGSATRSRLDIERQRYYTASDGVVQAWNLGTNFVGAESAGDLGVSPFVSGNSFGIGPELGAFFAADPLADVKYTRFFDLDTGRLLEDLQPLGAGSPVPLKDGRFVFSRDGAQVFFDPRTGEEEILFGCATDDGETCRGTDEPFVEWFINASLDGSELSAAREDEASGVLLFLDPQSGEVRSEMNLELGIDYAAVFTKDWIMGQRGDSTAFVVDRTTGEDLWSRNRSGGGEVLPSQDAVAIVVRDSTVLILEFDTWEERTIDLGFQRIRGLSFSPDGALLAVGDQDDLHIVDMARGELLQSIPIPLVSDVHWLGDTEIVLGTRLGLWITLDFDTARLIEAARSSVTRTFTEQECLSYRIDPCPAG